MAPNALYNLESDMFKNPMQFAWKVLAMIENSRDGEEQANSIKWYMKLNINQRINIKQGFILLCGVDWQEINFLFSLKERINLMYQKLIDEGIINEKDYV